MLIIEKQPHSGDIHRIQSQDGMDKPWIEGYIEVPAELEQIVWSTLGAGEIVMTGDIMTDFIPAKNQAVFQQSKAARIQQSNSDLAAYLKSHPLLWTDGNYYSITEEKQAHLTSKLAVAQAKATLGVPYELKWNTTEEVCVPWELSDLYALAFAIDERVTALVTYQQAQEVAIRNAATQDELDAIIIDYDTVQ